MATHSSIPAWRIPWTEESGRLQSRGPQRIRHDWVTSLHFREHSLDFYLADLQSQESASIYSCRPRSLHFKNALQVTLIQGIFRQHLENDSLQRHIPREAAHYIHLAVVSPPTFSHCSPHAWYLSLLVQSLSHVWLLRPHESQHNRPPCPSQPPGVYSNSCP